MMEMFAIVDLKETVIYAIGATPLDAKRNSLVDQ